MIVAPFEILLKNGKKLILKSVKPAEAQLLLDHLRISHRESYQNLNRDGQYWEKVTLEEEEKILTNIENANMRFMLGAFDNDKIVAGLGIFGSDPGTFTRFTGMLGISIQKAFQNTGLGTAMMNYAIEKCKESGLHRLELSVRTYNPEGIALYEKVGFRRIGTLTDTAFIDGKFVSEYLYEKIL
jgi:RimJ/RimL family protein N-acetyltransferase